MECHQFIYGFDQFFDDRLSAPGAARNVDGEDDAFMLFDAFIELMAINNFFLGPKAVMPNSVKFSGVKLANNWISISLITKVPEIFLFF